MKTDKIYIIISLFWVCQFELLAQDHSGSGFTKGLSIKQVDSLAQITGLYEEFKIFNLCDCLAYFEYRQIMQEERLRKKRKYKSEMILWKELDYRYDYNTDQYGYRSIFPIDSSLDFFSYQERKGLNFDSIRKKFYDPLIESIINNPGNDVKLLSDHSPVRECYLITQQKITQEDYFHFLYANKEKLKLFITAK